MNMIKIATYNINSVRLRIERVKTLLQNENIDILCLQETKVEDDKFPLTDFENLGYENTIYKGQKSYNGVSIISRLPLSNIYSLDLINDQKRHIAATLPNGTEVHNFYIPAGGDEPDTEINPKFAHKLDYVDAMSDWFKENRSPDDNIIIVGDFNIAPYENDVWSHKQLLKIISHTPIEVEKLNNLKHSLNWIDTARHFVPETEKLFSWWSYRSKDWRKNNRGRRLDHIWTTTPLKNKYKNFEILSNLRDGEKPSDHVPVILEIDI